MNNPLIYSNLLTLILLALSIRNNYKARKEYEKTLLEIIDLSEEAISTINNFENKLKSVTNGNK